MNKTIKMTERELEIVFDALQLRLDEMRDTQTVLDTREIEDQVHELEDLMHDLMEQDHRLWSRGRDNDAVPDAALDMIQAGIDAREVTKASSQAAQRRQQALSDRLMGGTPATLANDPIDW